MPKAASLRSTTGVKLSGIRPFATSLPVVMTAAVRLTNGRTDSSGALPAVRLTEIFRQAQQSLIVMNAHRINRGEMPDLKNVKSDFFFMRRSSEEDMVELIRELCTTRLPKNMGIPPEQIQVLSPTRKGGVGTVALNKMLQSALNPSGPDKREHQ